MNILYIIGNGLDIAHHMKTSYQDFFKYYLSLPSDDDDVQSMKKDINNHRYETWADLEMGMGAYSSKCANKDIFLKCLTDIKSNLEVYLQKESEKIKLYELGSYNNFIYPGSLFDPEQKNRYDSYRTSLNSDIYINVMTFNYTSTLEWLFDFKGKTKLFSPSVRLESIQHVHGMLNNMMVMGVNDSTQISNSELSTDIDIVEEFVKPEYNDACMNSKNSSCESLIEKADVIVLYGTSLGQSDTKWWKLIGQRMNRDNYPLLVYLPYDESKDQAKEPNHLRRWVMQSVRKVKEKFDIQLDEKNLAFRMCVAFNKQLFDIARTPQRPDERIK